jgi:hypothetical protein
MREQKSRTPLCAAPFVSSLSEQAQPRPIARAGGWYLQAAQPYSGAEVLDLLGRHGDALAPSCVVAAAVTVRLAVVVAATVLAVPLPTPVEAAVLAGVAHLLVVGAAVLVLLCPPRQTSLLGLVRDEGDEERR